MSIASAPLVLFDLDLPPNGTNHPRILRVFVDGVLHEQRTLPADARLVSGLRATQGAIIRFRLTDDPLADSRTGSFMLPGEPTTLELDGVSIRAQGDLLGLSSHPMPGS